MKSLHDDLRSGKRLFGTMVASASPEWYRAIDGQPDVDVIFIDTEHIAIDRTELARMCQLYARMGIPTIVRIPEPDPYAATVAMDLGATGVVAPYIETVEQVLALRGAVKCRPLKGERLAAHLEGRPDSCGATIEPALLEFMAKKNAGKALVINIESTVAIANLDALLAAGGDDLAAVLIGPSDLSCSLGVPGQYDHPRFKAACVEIFQKARAAGVGAGIHTGNVTTSTLEMEKFFVENGCNLLFHASDIQLFREKLKFDLRRLKEALGEEVAEGGGEGEEMEAI
jgi:4-hydroxy-2-oxoheptanedioate aldolase